MFENNKFRTKMIQSPVETSKFVKYFNSLQKKKICEIFHDCKKKMYLPMVISDIKFREFCRFTHAI